MPHSIFKEVHWKKDPGAIPIGFSKLGYKVFLIVGRMNAIKNDSIETIELCPYSRYLDELEKEFDTVGSSNKYIFKVFKKIKKIISYIKESINAAKLFTKINPSIILIEHTGLSSIFSIIIYRFISKKISHKSINKKVLIKLDIDPNSITNIHNNKNISSSFFVIILILVFILSDKTIVESKCAYDELSKISFLKRFIKKISIIPNGYVEKYIKSNENNRKNIILSVGRIAKQKGFDILIKSFQKVYQFHSDWQLRIVGPVVDEEHYKQLQKLIKELKLENSIIFTGEIDEKDLENEYNTASIFCLLSRYESFAIVRSEAIAHKLPLIISEAGCGIEYEKYGSIVVPIEDIDKPTKAMLDLIENSKLREEISKKQLNAILTWDEVAKKLEDISKL
ncbi:MAG: glycosyltransferase family 4 protein [Thermoplasmata archaeon]